MASKDTYAEGRSEIAAYFVETAREAILWTRSNGGIEYANKAACHMFGFSQEDIQSRKLSEIIANLSEENWGDLWRRSRSDGFAKLPIQWCSNSGAWKSLRVASRHLSNGDSEFALLTICDVTERKERERLLAAAVDSFWDTVAIIDQNGRLVFINAAGARRLGLTLDELRGKTADALFPPEIAGTRIAAVESAFSSGKSVRFEDSHAGMLLANIVHPLFDERTDMVKYAVVTSEDISARKKTEEDLRESEERYRTTVDSLDDIIHVMDSDLRLVLYNETFHKLVEQYGLNSSPLGKKLWEIFPSDSESLKTEYAKVLATGEVVATEEATQIGEETHWSETRKIPILGADGRVNRIITIIHDIAEHRRTENILRENERLLQDAQVIGALGTWTRDILTDKLWWSENLYRLLGFAPGEVTPSLQLVIELIHPDDRESTVRKLRDADAKVIPCEAEFRFISKAHETRHARVKTEPVYSDEGDPVAFRGIIQDITEQKEAELALRRSEEKYRLLAEQSIQGIVIIGDQGRIVYANPAFEKMVEYPLHTLKAMDIPGVETLLHPDDREMVLERMRSRLAGENPPDRYEYRLIDKSGNVAWVEMIATAVDWGGSRAILCTLVDVSERKSAERELRESTEINQAIVEHSPIGVSVRSRTGKLLAYNRAWQLIWRIPQARLQDDLNRDRDELRLDQRDSYLGEWQPAVQSVYEDGGYLYVPEARLLRSTDGAEYWVSQHYYAIKGDDGKVDRVVILTEDITDRKRTEKELQQSEQKFRELFDNMSSGVAIYSVVDGGNDFVFRAFNRGAEHIDRLSRDKVIGKRISEVFSGVEEFGMLDVLRRVWRTGQPERIPLALYEDERISGWRENYIYRLQSGEVVAVYDDVTERKRAEQALVESEERYRTLQENLPLGVFRTTPDDRHISVNPAYARMFGYDSVEDLLQKNVTEYYYDKNRRAELIRLLEEDGSFENQEIEMLRRDGSRFWITSNVRAARDTSGRILHLDGVVEDITRRRLVEEALRESEQRYRDLVEKSGIAIAIDDQKGRVTYCNKQFAKLFGFTSDEIRSQSHDSLVHPEDQAKVTRIHRLHMRGERGHTRYEFRGVRKDGKVLHLEVDVTPLKRDGVILGTRSFMSDISERKVFEERLRYHSDLLDSVSDAIISTDLELKVRSWNKAAETIYGWSVDEVIGRGILDVVPIDSGADGWERAKEILMRDGRSEIVSVQERKDGRKVDIFSSVTLLRDQFGNPSGAVAVNRDMTEKRRIERELRRLNEDLERRVARRTAELSATNRELETFAYSVSHDLRAPLRAIDGFSHILVSDYGPQLDCEGRRVLKIIRKGAQDMGKLIDNLLAFSRLGRQAIHETNIDMASLAEEVLKELKAAEPDRRIKVKFGALPKAEVDPDLMKVVFSNLLSNALKFTRQRERARIEVAARVEELEVIYRVSDNGVGFDMRYVDKLFNVFQRLHAVDEFEGTGVGLAIVQRIVHRHGGRVWAEGEPGKGATIYFALPRWLGSETR